MLRAKQVSCDWYCGIKMSAHQNSMKLSNENSTEKKNVSCVLNWNSICVWKIIKWPSNIPLFGQDNYTFIDTVSIDKSAFSSF